ncbi:hypothetical protein [Francisella marina]|nr:hypothetical protein [Francisella marina]
MSYKHLMPPCERLLLQQRLFCGDSSAINHVLQYVLADFIVIILERVD